MYLCLILIILIKCANGEINKTIQTFSVYNFGDYLFQLDNKDDELNIDVPPDTLIFISSITGYKATIKYQENDKIQTLNQQLLPNPQDRLIYFKNIGYINVTSTINSLQFTLHTLVLTKISNKYDEIIISTNPYENFRIYHNNLLSKTYDYNSSFTENHLLWFIASNFTMCYIRQDVSTSILIDFYTAYPILYAFPFGSYDESEIKFTRISISTTQTQWLNSYSKLILIEKVESLSKLYGSQIRIRCEPNFTNVNYYTDYRSIFHPSSFNETRILRRGTNHIKYTSKIYSKDLSEGIVEFDFSIYNKIELNINHTLLIFPTVSTMRNNFESNYCNLGIIQRLDKLTLESGTYDFIDVHDMNVPIIIYYYKQDSPDMNYIISTSPNEYISIGNRMIDNYTNDHEFKYFMASLADTKTIVKFNGEVTIKKIELGRMTNIPIESGSVIKGPFVAHIMEGSECSFQTFLNNENQEDSVYENDGFAFFKQQTAMESSKNLLLSKKYGIYRAAVQPSPSTSIIIDDDFSYLIETSNLVHIWPREGWSGEVLLDDLKDNKIGHEYNRTSFYIPKSGESSIRIMIWKTTSNYANQIELYIRTIPIEKYEEGTENNCSRVVVFNDIPRKFGINLKPNEKYQEINFKTDEVLCVFPAVSHYYVGSNASIEVINSNNENAASVSTIYNEEYCRDVLFYDYYGEEHYTFIKLDHKSTDPSGVIAFRKYGISADQGPEETMIYYDFEIKDEFAIHTFGENKYTYIEDGDDIIIETPTPSQSISSTNNAQYRDVTIELNETNKQEFIDMNGIRRLSFSCPKSTIFFIHYMQGFVVKFYDNKQKRIKNEIGHHSSTKIIHFGMSNGVIVVERSDSHSSSSNNLFVYSFVILDDINGREGTKRCENIYISSDPIATVTIKGPDNDSKRYNHILPNNKSLCLWFTFPIYSTLKSDVYLPHHHFMFVDCTEIEIQGSKSENIGFNFISFLGSVTSTNESNHAEFKASAFYSSDMLKINDFEIVNDLFIIDSSNGILLKSTNTDNPKGEIKKKGKKKFNPIFLIISLISVAIVITALSIIVVACLKHKQVSNRPNSSENSDSVSDTAHNDHNQSNCYTNSNVGGYYNHSNDNDDTSPYNISNAQYNQAQAIYISPPPACEADDVPYPC